MSQELQTNAGLKKGSALHKKGCALVEAGYEYWKEYQKSFRPGAVVYLELENGHFILFTRSEYKQQILAVVDRIGGDAIDHPFTD